MAPMKIQVQVGGKWREAEATIDAHGVAQVMLPFPYGYRAFKVWRPIKAKRNGKKTGRPA